MSSIFKIYSPEDCDFYYDGELQGHIEGNSDRAFRFEVEKKGMYRFKFVNSEYKSELIEKVSIDADEEREVELDFSEVNEPVIQERERIIIAIEHDYGTNERLPEEIISTISKDGFITIPKGVRKIGRFAFYNCKSLKSITIPNSVTEIGAFAFKICRSLTSITIPDSVTDIRAYAFSGCSSLKSITIPKGVTTIYEDTFAQCSGLTSIKIPNGITDIRNGAFAGCSNLTSITIPDSVTEIRGNAFKHCNSLTMFYGKYASSDNRCLIKDGILLAFAPKDITKYIIPNDVTKIGGSAFNGCSSLTSITIPNSVTTIINGAFAGCSKLTSITIPDSVTEIRGNAFYGCNILTRFYGKYASSDNRCLIKDSILLAFASYGFIKYTIPNGVTTIGELVFSDCSRLKSITIPNGVTTIEHSAFRGCSSLTSITIPNSVTEIEMFAFDFCDSLTSIYCKATTPPNAKYVWGKSKAYDRKIYVPKSEGSTILKAYKSAEGWKTYADIIEEYDFDNE